jgi:mono/diheme cytochrome c family protein
MNGAIMSGAIMKAPLISGPLLALGMTAAGMALGEPPNDARTKPAHQVFESSIGGVVAASQLPGAVGQGYLVYYKWCAGCHAAPFQLADPAATGKLSPVSRLPLGTNLLQQRYNGALPAALEQRTDLTSEAIGFYVRHGSNAMPAFRKTEISDAELGALSEYLTRNRTPPKSSG